MRKEHLTDDDVNALKISAFISILVAIIFTIYYVLSNEFENIKSYFYVVISCLSNAFFSLWFVLFSIYLIWKKRANIATLSLLIVLITLAIFSIAINAEYTRSRIERSKIDIYEGEGYLKFYPISETNETYERKINFSIQNNSAILSGLVFKLRFLENITNLNIEDEDVDYSPKENLLIEPIISNSEIFLKWKKTSDKNIFLTFNVSWDKEKGKGKHAPVDISETFIESGTPYEDRLRIDYVIVS